MARDGQRIFDTDTHVGPSMAILENYMSAADRARLEPLREGRRENEFGVVNYQIGARRYLRKLGATSTAAETKYMTGFEGAHKGREPNPHGDEDPALRIADLEFEGVDVNLLLPSGWFGVFTSLDDRELELACYRAYHRWMKDYCGAYPERLGGVILLSARSVEESLQELERAAREPWAWAVFPYVPYGMPLDDPSLEPFWAAAQAHDLSVVLHTFTVMPPYAPGGTDTWDNMFLQRSAAHVWCGERNMAAIIGAGILDRYPSLRLGVLEAGHGWLPQWAARLDEHAKSVRTMLPELKLTPTEYVQSGRYFQSIEAHEGWPITEAVMGLLGDQILMYASDYPHSESWFPKTVDSVLAWEMPVERREKLFWKNPIRFYPRAGYSS